MVIINCKRISILVSILGLLGSYVVGLPEQAIAFTQPQVLQIAEANPPKQEDIKTRLLSVLNQLVDIKTVPLSLEQNTKLEMEVNSINNSIATINNLNLREEWDEIKAIIKPLQSINGGIRSNNQDIVIIQNILISKNFLYESADGGWGSTTKTALTKYLSSKKDKVDSLLKSPVAVASPAFPAIKPTVTPSTDNKNQTNPFDVGILFLYLLVLVLAIASAFSLLRIYHLKKQVKNLEHRIFQDIQGIKTQNPQDIKHKDHEIRKIKDDQKKQIEEITYLKMETEKNTERITSLERKIGKNIETKAFNENAAFSNPQKIQSHNAPAVESYKEVKAVSKPSLADIIAQRYNDNPDELLKYSTRVSETEESISKRRTDNSYSIALGEIDNGNYWILSSPNNESIQWLVPMGGLEIDKYIFKTVEALFFCSGKLSDSFNLVKPAIVISTDKGEWQLKEKGQIEFTE